MSSLTNLPTCLLQYIITLFDHANDQINFKCLSKRFAGLKCTKIRTKDINKCLNTYYCEEVLVIRDYGIIEVDANYNNVRKLVIKSIEKVELLPNSFPNLEHLEVTGSIDLKIHFQPKLKILKIKNSYLNLLESNTLEELKCEFTDVNNVKLPPSLKFMSIFVGQFNNVDYSTCKLECIKVIDVIDFSSNIADLCKNVKTIKHVIIPSTYYMNSYIPDDVERITLIQQESNENYEYDFNGFKSLKCVEFI